MKEKQNTNGQQSLPHKDNSLNALRRQLKNKLIEVGIACGQTGKQELGKISSQRGTTNESSKLPCLPSLKPSLIVNYEDARLQLSHKVDEIFSHRDLFIGREGFAGSKGSRSRKHSRDSSQQSIQDSFRKRVMENVKLHKMEEKFPSLKQSTKVDGSRFGQMETIFIRALREHKRSKVIIHASSRGRLVHRSKTEERQPKQKKGKNKKKDQQRPQCRQLTPWNQEQVGGWHQIL